MQEIWKDIPNYQGYQVSNKGRVRTKNKTTFTKKHGLRRWKDRILSFKGSTYATGYRVDLWKDGKPKTFLVARLVAFTFKNEDINNHKLTIDHIDGNRFNNNLENLDIVSLKENIQRAFENGLMSSQIGIKLINKETNEELCFKSMTKASKYMNKNGGYICTKNKKGIFENDEYRWEIVNE